MTYLAKRILVDSTVYWQDKQQILKYKKLSAGETRMLPSQRLNVTRNSKAQLMQFLSLVLIFDLEIA